MTERFPPSIEIAKLYERTSAKGTRYMSGWLGLGRVNSLPGEPAEDGTPTWRLLIGARQTAGEKPAGGRTAPSEPSARPYAARRAYRAPRPPGRAGSGPLAGKVDDLWPEGGR